MIAVLRNMGMPPMMVGVIKQMGKDIPDEQLREMCARVGLGMLNIYVGGDVQESLDMNALTTPDMDNLIGRLTLIRDTNALETEPFEVAELVETDVPCGIHCQDESVCRSAVGCRYEQTSEITDAEIVEE